ncbi:MAG: endopeptidase La [Muribaculaceae bacterium]|nr:endopeptidase La [Muribaculaceae bacterium]
MINYFKDFDNELNDETSHIMPIVAEIKIGEDNEDDIKELDVDDMPILALRNMVLFPNVTLPVAVGRQKSLNLISEAQRLKKPIGVICQKNGKTEDPNFDELNSIGVIADIVKILELPDNSTNVILQGRGRFHLDEITSSVPYIKGKITTLNEVMPKEDDQEFMVLMSSIRDLTYKILQNIGDEGKEMFFAIKNIDSPFYLINFLAANFPIEPKQKQKLLEQPSIKKRAYSLYSLLTKEAQLIEIKADIQSKTREDITQQQREHFLQQQIRTIQDELGDSVQDQDIEELNKRASKKKWGKEIAAVFAKEIKKLERIHPQSPDFSVQFNYLDSLLNLPWNEFTNDNFNLKKVEKQLNKDHYGLENVKDRIIEHLAVLKLRSDMKAPIICLYGPPGVGKTSLGKSIADALNRKYVRISLGGLHDEAEIRGHRRTYIGAMPGRIIQGLIKGQSSNPVFVLDEIDKLGQDFKGDPSSALLEVLDPEQNNHFHDNFIDLDYDLSKIFFIATANSLVNLPQPLLDRMELIDVSGYIIEEKIEIARKHLVVKQLENHGFEKKEIDFPKNSLAKIIESYTRESGVRELDKKIAKVLRRIARLKASDEEYPKVITLEKVRELLGVEEYTRDKYEGNDFAGVVTGLAWTAVGGEILFVESSLSKGKGEKLTLTGNLGDVMKESAIIALQYLKAHSSLFKIDYELFDKYNIHIHVPEGAIPKDGPSAGITMATSLASIFTQRKVKDHLAMTGEITLRGKVLPVGGIKEKILAAKRAGITDIVLCNDNKKDIEEIKPEYLNGLTFHYVKTVKDVIDIALTDEIIKGSIDI